MPHQHPHPHHHGHHDDREGAATLASEESYPYVYSKDPYDPRRFMRPGDVYGPALRRLPRSDVVASWLVIVGVAAIFIASLAAAAAGH
jgi:hypothetical protein